MDYCWISLVNSAGSHKEGPREPACAMTAREEEGPRESGAVANVSGMLWCRLDVLAAEGWRCMRRGEKGVQMHMRD